MRILITIQNKSVAPRFDLTTEVVIALCEGHTIIGKPRTILMTRPSSEELCALIIKENINTVVCNGIEESHLQYLTWKRMKVIHSVVGPYSQALKALTGGFLRSGTILEGAKQGVKNG